MCSIIPAWVPEEIFPTRTAASQINYWQPLGTLSVASSLMKAGHDVKFLSGAFLSHAEILNALAAGRPDFVGIYSTAFGWNKALRTAANAKSLLPGVFIAVGGPYPMAIQEKCLEDSPWIDAVVTGEGEITVVELLERLTRRRVLPAWKVWRSGLRGGSSRTPAALHHGPRFPPFPARELLGDEGRYIPPPATYRRKPVAVIMTSRGCNRRCIYCFPDGQGKNKRHPVPQHRERDRRDRALPAPGIPRNKIHRRYPRR